MTVPSGEGFPKTARVRRRQEYLALGRRGRKRHAAHFVVCAQQAEGGGASRLGVTVSRKVGGAVSRNRLRRRIREIFRRHPRRLVVGHALLIIAKPGAAELPFDGVAREIAAAVAALSPQRARA